MNEEKNTKQLIQKYNQQKSNKNTKIIYHDIKEYNKNERL